MSTGMLQALLVLAVLVFVVAICGVVLWLLDYQEDD
jgi:hypothetical protein